VWGHAPDDPYFDGHDWADTEAQALIDGTAAIKQLAAGRRAIVCNRHDYASDKLKDINHAKRVTRWSIAPADGSDPHAIEYLYDQWGNEFRISKKTRKRVYYMKDERIYYRDDPPKIWICFASQSGR
jgi:hypothetical protein